MNSQVITATIFILVYIAIVFFHHHRLIAVLSGVLALLILRIISFEDLVHYIDRNILGIILGTSIVAELFIRSRIPAYLAERLVDRTGNLLVALLTLSLFSGFLSAFIENVSTTLIMAPVAFEICRKQNISPVPFILGICLSANLQGSATLVGDPPSMILASHTKMSFNDFFFFNNRPGLFFAVEFGAFTSLAVLALLFRKLNKPLIPVEPEKVISWIPGIILLLLITSLVVASFFRHQTGNISGGIALFYGLLAILYGTISGKFKDGHLIFKGVDFFSLFFLAGIFILVGALKKTGVVHYLAFSLGQFLKGNLLSTYIGLILASVLISALVDNIPYFAAVVGIITELAQTNNYPLYLLLFGTIIATTVGGNITPIGASANIVATGLLRKQGYKISFGNFIKIGLPFTLASVFAATIFIWFIWH
jgi:Na+/H+ antiporter NhaD/arsenite permease-like protein